MNSGCRRERWARLVHSRRLRKWLMPSVLDLLEAREKKMRTAAGGGRAGAGRAR